MLYYFTEWCAIDHDGIGIHLKAGKCAFPPFGMGICCEGPHNASMWMNCDSVLAQTGS